jgi:branched-chain amino acid transport system substrate-binding protein
MAATRWRVFVGGALLAALVGTACSSSGSSGGSSAGSTPTSAPKPGALGPVKRATGAPLKIGYIYAGQAQNQDNTNEITMAKGTVKYINEHLGGVAGRPLDLVVCADHLTPAGATDCANQMLAAKVPVVLGAEPANPAPILKLLEPAKVPFFIQTAADTSSFFSPDSYVLNNPLIILAAPIKVAKDAGVKKVAMVYVDVPAASQLKSIGTPMFQKAGLQLLPTAVPLGTPDLTPQVQAALSSGAQMFVVIGDASLCVNSLKALKTLGFTGKVATNLNCLTDAAAKAIPGGFDGLVLPITYVDDGTSADSVLLHAVAATYAPGTPTDATGQSVLGFIMTIAFVRAMKGLRAGAGSAAEIAAAFAAAPPQAVPLLPGQTFQCNRKRSTLTPAVCSNGASILTLDTSGKTTKSETFDATPYLQT